MNNAIILLMCFLMHSLGCIAQTGKKDKTCNRDVVDRSIGKLLPEGVCIPEGYTIEKVVKDFDFNRDGKYDVALKYIKYPVEDGNMRHYSVYEQINDSVYQVKKQLNNLSVPFIKALTASYRKSNPIADSLINLYPITRKVVFSKDTLSVEHRIPDDFGKTYIFIYDIDRKNWYLQKIKYWTGELPVWLVRNGDLREELLTEKIYLEEKEPEERISIDEFDLIESKRIADTEESTYLMNNYDIFEIGAKD